MPKENKKCVVCNCLVRHSFCVTVDIFIETLVDTEKKNKFNPFFTLFRNYIKFERRSGRFWKKKFLIISRRLIIADPK